VTPAATALINALVIDFFIQYTPVHPIDDRQYGDECTASVTRHWNAY
jgi:hypothetical protein